MDIGPSHIGYCTYPRSTMHNGRSNKKIGKIMIMLCKHWICCNGYRS